MEEVEAWVFPRLEEVEAWVPVQQLLQTVVAAVLKRAVPVQQEAEVGEAPLQALAK
ncbi:hypothetical protein DIPPA_18469 [Diplonema papillatum]|nr:hypothetical protein DIPPA_18469 [Diplonema papillatum]